MKVRVPFIPLRGQTFFPNTIVGFDIGRDKSLKSLDAAMSEDKYLVVATQKDVSVNAPKEEDIFTTGVEIRVKQIIKRHEEYVRVLAECGNRVKLSAVYDEDDTLYCDYEVCDAISQDDDELNVMALVRVLKETYFSYVEMSNSGEAAARALIDGVEDSVELAYTIAGELAVPFDVLQGLLELNSVNELIEQLIETISRENEVLTLTKRINNRVMQNMNKGQREYYLREQLNVIKEELGENDDDTDDEANGWLKKLDELKLDEKVDEKLRKEIPWNEESKVNTNIRKAEKTLNNEHYGLTKVKERIIEQLAVMHLTKGAKGPIICLVGPPGVGKTSIARSIAHATNREFVRMSLGGVRDEAEIRGHRRTYVGAIPGRVINNFIEAGTNNPLFLLDEIDKIGSDFRGDPASALLEVLDPEQNKTFTDHYLEVPFDLSRAMFITTANTTQTIPRALLDRMEIIELSSYIEEEKVHIAEDYLIPKQLKEHAIRKSQLAFSESSIRDIINYYTREAGVRNLERAIGSICRKVAKNIVTEKKHKYLITSRNLEKYLGKKIFREDLDDLSPQVGVTTGMAWTAVGGVTLEIETIKMSGSGKLILTGQMGDVMKESAQAALGYIRSVASKYNIPDSIFKDNDIQVHIPEGATPKDGPSAGVTMCSALFSTLSGKKVRRDVAMTGEITLRGMILPVGGIKEKVLAAYRQGIRKILLPADNKRDIEEIPLSVRKKLDFVFLETVEDAFKEIILEDEDSKKHDNSK